MSNLRDVESRERQGRYRPLGPIAAGAMGVVDRVYDRLQAREVARKRIKRPSAAAFLRMRREFRALEKLRHPNLIRVFDLDVEGDALFFTMEIVEGLDLKSWVAGGERVARITQAVRQLMDCLDYIHAEGIVHRDLKPDNVRVRPDGVLKVLDFGVLQEVGRPELGGTVIAGSAAYMPPEQIRGEPARAASDYYAFGAMLFELVSGRVPFTGSREEVLAAHLERAPPSLEALGLEVHPALARAVTALLDKDPERRPDAARLEEILLAPLEGRAPAWRRPRALLGRERVQAELRRLTRGPDTARLLAIRGPSGSGKSRLLDGLLRELVQEGEVVLRSSARTSRRTPFNALEDCVDDLARMLPPLSELPESTRAAAERAAELFPVLERHAISEMEDTRRRVRRRLFPGADAPQSPPPSQAALFDALLALISAVAAPTVWLAIDDFQWTDDDSLSFLAHALRNGTPAIGLVVALRDDAEDRLASRWLESQPDLARVALEPLHADALEEIIRRAAGPAAERLPAQEIAALVRLAEGRPFLAEVLGRALAVGDAAPGGQAVQHLVRELPAPHTALLALLAAQDRWTALSELPALLSDGFAEIDDRVGELEARGLVRRDGSERVDLYHDGVRQAALAVLPEEVRLGAHSRLADRLLGRPHDLAERVRHLVAAKRIEEAARSAITAAEAAEALCAYSLAADLVEVALRVPGDDARALRHRRARLLERAGRYQEACGVWAELRPGADHATLLGEAHALIAASRTHEGLEQLDRALVLSGDHGTTVSATQGLSAFGRFLLGPRRRGPQRGRAHDPARAEWAAQRAKIGVLLSFHDPAAGLHFLLRARRGFEQAGADAQVANCDYLLAALALIGNTGAGPVPLAERYLASARRWRGDAAGPPELEGMAPFVEGVMALRAGRWDEVKARMRTAAEIFLGAAGTTERMMALSFGTMADVYRQDLPAMKASLTWFHRNAAESGESFIVSHTLLLTGYIAFLEGRFEDARRIILSRAERFEVGRPNTQAAAAHLYRHLPDLYSPDPAAARAAFLAAAKRTRRFGFLRTMYGPAFGMIGGIIEVNAIRARDPRAEPRRARMYAEAIDRGAPLAAGTSWRIRAYLASAAGREEESLAHLVRAESEAERHQRELDRAIARFQRGLRIGGEEGRALVDEAERAVGAMGASRALLEEDFGFRSGRTPL